MNGEHNAGVGESEELADVHCIRCSQRINHALHIMGCVGVQGYPVRVVDLSGAVLVPDGWAVSLERGQELSAVIVHDTIRGGFQAWPPDWVAAQDVGD